MSDDRQQGEGAPRFEVSPALAGAIALVVAGLAAVGVSGGLLARAVRNAPGLMAAVVSMAILVPGIALAVGQWRSHRRAAAVGIGALAVVSVYAVLLGAASLVLQENPSVSVSAERTSDGYQATVDARAAGLRADGDMLVQLVGLREFPKTGSFSGADGLERACSVSRLTTPPDKAPPSRGPLLAWQQAGPDSSGDAAVSFDVAVPSDRFQGLCAAAIYQSGPTTLFGNVRSWLRLPRDPKVHVSVAVVRLS